MAISRRGVLGVAAFCTITANPVSAPAPGKRVRRVSQQELTSAIVDHAIWLSDISRGQRANFAGCDLTGLDFSPNGPGLTDLRDADFTGADLTGVTGAQVSFLRAGLHGANLSDSHFTRPTFSYASLRNSICDRAIWGYSDSAVGVLGRPDPAEAAAFHHCDFGRAQLRYAMIRGFFWESSFTCANLQGADFSYSLFLGLGSFCTSFAYADLKGTKFCGAELDAVRFYQARLEQTDFSQARISLGVASAIKAAAGG